MPVSNAQREYWTQKNPSNEYDTITFIHPAFDEPIRLVANEFNDQEFNGLIYRACAMEIKKPEQGKDPISSIDIKFPRPYVGDEFDRAISKLDPFDWLTSITMQLMMFTEMDRVNPTQNWTVFVSENGISTNKGTVQVKASDDNPMILNSSQTYETDRYPSLEFL